MASLYTHGDGCRTIQFKGADKKRHSIRLGKMPKRLAEEIKTKVQALANAGRSGLPPDGDTAAWLAKIGDELADKLAGAGLIEPRHAARLGDFLSDYIAGHGGAKPRNRTNLEAARQKLVDFFGAEKPLRAIKPGDADDWKAWLKNRRYAGATVGRAVRYARQFFRYAKRKHLVAENPFEDIAAPPQVNESRKFFVGRDATQAVLDACPNAEWRLIVALSRYAGVRCPSETLALRWPDVDWERDRFWVSSPKTEEHEGHEGRWVPLFPELRPYFEAAFEEAPEGAVYVIRSYRDPDKNFRTRMLKIIKRAGLKPWPKPFQNLRASRETELAAEYPIHVVCAWIGNSALIAKKHYLQVTEDYFQRAAGGAAQSGATALQKAVLQPAAPSPNSSQRSAQPQESCELISDGANNRSDSAEKSYAWRDSNPQPMAP